jgi:hypothetical protein
VASRKTMFASRSVGEEEVEFATLQPKMEALEVFLPFQSEELPL